MKRFRFSLRAVAVLRQHEELRAQEAFAASVGAVTRERAALQDATARVAELGDALMRARAVAMAPAQAAGALASYGGQCAQEAAVRLELARAEQRMQQRRAEYVEAHRKVEMLSKLEKKARAHHRAGVQREEQGTFDDRASQQRALPWQRQAGKRSP